jgi:DNA-directed RNA polymerase specialized sigma24 family protein
MDGRGSPVRDDHDDGLELAGWLDFVRVILPERFPSELSGWLELLTPRQRRILYLRAMGYSSEQVGRVLGHDRRTVNRELERCRDTATASMR